MKKQNKKGFTLTELIVVIAVIAILAAVLIPALTGYIDRAKQSAFEQECEGINDVLVNYLTEYGYDEDTQAKTFAEYYEEIAGEALVTADDAATDELTITYASGKVTYAKDGFTYEKDFTGSLADALTDVTAATKDFDATTDGVQNWLGKTVPTA